MENNESKLKPQSTGGLKLMTVFIAVLALHVLVIGGVTIYHLMSGGGTDADLADGKAPKDAKVSADGSVVMDSQLPDGSQPDKTATADTPAPAPAIEQTTPAETASAPVTAPVADAPASAPVASTPTGPVVTPPEPPAPAPTPEPAVAEEPAAAPPLESEVPAAPVASGTYVVKMHDTLARIARRHHTTVAKIKAKNGLKGELLHVGERLVIPGRTEVAAAPAADASGATNLSGSPVVASDETTPAPAFARHHLYTVMKGDTLTRIAHKFRTTARALMLANNITDPTRLSIGRKLRIPSREAQATMTVRPETAPAAEQPVQPKAAGQLANFVQ